MRRQRGFTLMEISVVVAILGVLAAFAVPAYREQLRRTQRREAVANLQQLQLALQAWRAEHPSYGNPRGLAGYPALPAASSYRYAFGGGATATEYFVSATPLDAQARDACGVLSLQHLDGRVTKTPDSPGCW